MDQAAEPDPFFRSGPLEAGDGGQAVGLAIADIREQLERANWHLVERRAVREIEMLVVHWSGGGRYAEGYDELGNMRSETRYHINKDWGGGVRGHGLMYHYKIGRSGRVYWTRSWEDVTWHATRANRAGLAVCLDATTGDEPTLAQLASLELLLGWLQAELPKTRYRVWGHGELEAFGNATSCPGERAREVAGWLRAGL